MSEGILPAYFHIEQFAHSVGMAFEANLVYSFLQKLGAFSSDRVDVWRKGLVAEAKLADRHFNSDAFDKLLAGMSVEYKQKLQGAAKLPSWWAVGACVASLVAQWIISLKPDLCIHIFSVAIAALLLYGAVPSGLIWHYVIDSRCTKEMNNKAESFLQVMEFVDPKQVVDAANSVLDGLSEDG